MQTRAEVVLLNTVEERSAKILPDEISELMRGKRVGHFWGIVCVAWSIEDLPAEMMQHNSGYYQTNQTKIKNACCNYVLNSTKTIITLQLIQ